MADVVALLQGLGFSEYEARAYQTLVQHGPVTGYELAKVSRIPRPNIYPVLQKLEERGAVVRLNSEGMTRYAAVPPEELLTRIGHRFQDTLETAMQALQALVQPRQHAYVWNVQGYANLVSHAQALITSANRSCLLALWPEEARVLTDEFAQAEARGVSLTTLCLASCPQECGGCRGQIYRSRVIETQDARWLLLVTDDDEVLAGEIPSTGDVSVVRTRQALLVEMTAWFVRHSIALAGLLLDTDNHLDEMLTAQTWATFTTVGPPGSAGWLAHMRRLLRQRKEK
jgi:sugar-specific transcriptional regulator TrmB